MNIGREVLGLATSPTGKIILPVVLGVMLGWIGNMIAGWWKSRDRYRAHVTIQSTDTMYGEEELPVIVIQSVHYLPINVTRLRVRNGFRWKVDQSPFYSVDYDDYPTLPRQIEPMKSTKFWLDEDALRTAVEQSRFLRWLWVPRVYVGVETMGRGERLFIAEGGLSWNERRKRFRR
jgi:hypothetical protein